MATGRVVTLCLWEGWGGPRRRRPKLTPIYDQITNTNSPRPATFTMTWFITLACFACFAYGSLLQGSPAGKATPILLLAYGSVMRTPKTPPSAAYAFLFSAFGDMLLAMDDKKPGGDGSAFFLCGLVSFAIAHVCFGVAFLSKGARQGAARPELLTWHAIPFIMYAGVMYMTLLPGLVKDGPFMVVAAGVYVERGY